jgi:hypothetical protein
MAMGLGINCLAQSDSIAKRQWAKADSSVNVTLKENNAQKKLLAISTDLLLTVWSEYNVSVEYQLSDNVAIGGSFSQVVPGRFQVNPLAKPQWSWPGNIYNGFAERVYVKYYPGKKVQNGAYYVYERPKNNRGYWCFQIDAKQMHYTNHTFVDDVGEEEDINTVATANQNVLDFAIFYGREFIQDKHFFADIFFGLGYRMKWITQTIISSQPVSGGGYSAPPGYEYWPVGTTNYFKSLPFPQIGLRIGFTIPHSINR